jgi:hypothetical protein
LTSSITGQIGFLSYAVDPIRQKIDEAIARALKLGDDFEVYRSLYAAEPLLSGHAPDSVGGNVTVSMLIVQQGWRKRRDSNPRYPFGYASFQDWSHQPLGHSSVLKV